MNKHKKKIDLILAFVINFIFLNIYTRYFWLIQESNDDLAMSFMAEGAYGSYSEYLIFENVLWGKFLVGMYQWMPSIKWYNVTFFIMIFVSFWQMSYVFLRAQGRKIGSAVSAIMLIFCGYHTYVLFQFSRVTSIATIGGMIMLFYALEHAEDKLERNLCVLAGGALTIWASMMRFQMFGVCVILVGGALAIYRLWKLLREKPVDLKKQILTYIGVFGVVGGLCLGLHLVDNAFYEMNPQWKEYKEYNEIRADLWDTGFPDYNANYEMYQSLGISENDFIYFLSWEMDEEVLTLDVLKTIQAAKPQRTFSLSSFLDTFPKGFLGMSVYTLFVVLALAAIALDKKCIYFVAYEFIMVMCFEALFFWMRRFGVERIDSGMWMAACLTLLYATSETLSQRKEHAGRWSIAAAGIAMIVSMSLLNGYTHIQLGKVGSTKSFYQEVTADKEHLYVMLTTAPSVYYAYNFWEPCQQGDLSNVYNAFGWEYNVEVKHEILENYGITNIYRDSINNDDIYFIAGPQAVRLEVYIRENYHPDAYLNYIGSIGDYFVWSIKVDE